MILPPSDEILLLKTPRLRLEPILISHATEMVEVLKDPELYEFVPQDPPTLTKLEQTYEFWSKRISPAGDEIWLNWAARLVSSGELIGHFQAGLKAGPDSNIAYTVGLKHQRKGYAEEALGEIINFLELGMSLKSVKAWIDTRNHPSINLVEKLGMKRVDFLKGADTFKGKDSDEFVYQMILGDGA